MNPASKTLAKGELDLIASTFRMSAHFQRLRQTRRCRRCDAWLAVDQPDYELCSPCQDALQREGNGGPQ